MLIAVGSMDGREINLHFGHAERFMIYDVQDGAISLIEERQVGRYCNSEPVHDLRAPLLKATADALQGCRALVVARIGDQPKTELERLGLEVFELEGPIYAALLELTKIL